MKRLKLICTFILILAMGGPSCQKFNLNTDDLNIRLDMNIVKTHLIADFRDAKTGLLIGEDDNSQVSIYIIGHDSRSVVNTKGYRITETRTAGGYVTFGLDPYQAKPSGADTVRVTLMAELNGYVPTSVPIVFTSEGQQYVTVFMVNMVTPPEGVTISPNKSVGNSVDGKVSNGFNVSTPDKSLDVNVPAGMKILDAKGNPLQGKLDLTFVQADPTQIGAARSFPGGLTCEATTETGSKVNTSFDPACFSKIDISDESGRHGAFFSEGTMVVNAKIGPSVINPETGQPYKTGDKIGLWNLEEKTGQWNFIKNIFVGPDPLKVTTSLKMNTGSFGGSNLMFGGNVSISSCSEFLNFQAGINFTLDPFPEEAEFDIEVTGPNGFWVYTGHVKFTNNCMVKISNTKSGNYKVKFSYNGVRESTESPWILPSSPTVNFCQGPITGPTITLTRNPAIGRFITFDGYVFCTNRNAELTIPDGTLLHFREKGTLKWTTFSVSNKKVVARILINKTYEIQTLDDGQWTPALPYEYTLGPAEDFNFPYNRNLRLSIDCGK